MQQAAFFRAKRLLMCDLDESLAKAADKFVHINYNVEPVGVDVRPESLCKEDGQRAAVEFSCEYNRTMANSSGLDLEYQVPARNMVPTYLLTGLGPPACNGCLRGWNQHLTHPLSVEVSIFSSACEGWQRYLSDGHSLGGPSHGGSFYTP